jgi:hypothetical protein
MTSMVTSPPLAAVVPTTAATAVASVGDVNVNINGWFDKIGIGDVIINESVHYLNLNDILCLSTVNRYFHYLLNLSFIINQQQQPSSATSAPSSSSTSTSSASSTESIASISHVSTTQTINGRRVISLLPSQWLISSLIFHFDLSTLPLSFELPSRNALTRRTPNNSDYRYRAELQRYSHRIRSIRFREALPGLSSMSWPLLQTYHGIEIDHEAYLAFDEGKWLLSLPNLQSISCVPSNSLQDRLETQSLLRPMGRSPPTICGHTLTTCITCERLTWGIICAAYPSCPHNNANNHHITKTTALSIRYDKDKNNTIGGRQCRQCYRSSILKVPVTLHEQVRRIADIYGEWIVCSGGCERWIHNTINNTNTTSITSATATSTPTTGLHCDRQWIYCNVPTCSTGSRACLKCSPFSCRSCLFI